EATEICGGMVILLLFCAVNGADIRANRTKSRFMVIPWFEGCSLLLRRPSRQNLHSFCTHPGFYILVYHAYIHAEYAVVSASLEDWGEGSVPNDLVSF